jgi:hypothetical protein
LRSLEPFRKPSLFKNQKSANDALFHCGSKSKFRDFEKVLSSSVDSSHADYWTNEHLQFLPTLIEILNGVPCHRIANTDETMAGVTKSVEYSFHVFVTKPNALAIKKRPARGPHITILPCAWLDGTMELPVFFEKIAELNDSVYSKRRAYFKKSGSSWMNNEVFFTFSFLTRFRSSAVLVVGQEHLSKVGAPSKRFV